MIGGIENIEDIKQNIKNFEKLRHSKNKADYEWYQERVKLGKNFYPYLIEEDGKKIIGFIPSRFLGYKNNNIQEHENEKRNGKRDGKETNPKIDSIIGGSKENFEMESLYINFCQYIGAGEPSNRKHRFWDNDNIEDKIIDKIIISNIEKDTKHLVKTEREAVIKQRIGQTIFREKLMKYWDNKCTLTQCDIEKILTASHIKPWSKCKNIDEKLDLHNGFLFAPNIDKLFDKGFISFDNNGKIKISKRIGKKQYEILGISSNMKIRINERHKIYLEYHRNNIFEQIN